MTDLRPHRHPRPPAPLSAGARFIRGFTRIGAIAAVLVALIGGSFSLISAVNSYNSAVASHQSAQCIARLARSGYTFKKKNEYSSALDYSVGGCSDYYHSYESISEVIAIADSPARTFLTSDGASFLGWGLVVTGLVAVAAYVAFWAIGWLCAGFTRDT
jgi:hypothetical protein